MPFPEMPTYCYMDIALGSAEPRRVAMELFDDVCPRTCKNFADLCRGLEETVPGSDVPMSYKGSGFHRVIDGFMIQGGDYTNHNGTGGHSIYGSEFDDENFERLADRPGLLAMANRGPNTNGSQFFITCAATPHLNGKHTVFGKVVTGMNVVRAVESTPRGDNDKPVAPVVIKACGVLEARPEPEVAADGDKLPDYPVDCDPALDDAEKLAAGEEVRQLGNRAFGAQEFKRGVEKYEKALRYLDAAVPTSATGDDLKTKKVACWNNMALCLIKLEKWAPARKAAQAALDLDAANAKAVFRRATAHQALGDYDEAVADYKRVLELDAANGDAQARLAEVSQLMKAKKEKMAAQYKKMFA